MIRGQSATVDLRSLELQSAAPVVSVSTIHIASSRLTVTATGATLEPALLGTALQIDHSVVTGRLIHAEDVLSVTASAVTGRLEVFVGFGTITDSVIRGHVATTGNTGLQITRSIVLDLGQEPGEALIEAAPDSNVTLQHVRLGPRDGFPSPVIRSRLAHVTLSDVVVSGPIGAYTALQASGRSVTIDDVLLGGAMVLTDGAQLAAHRLVVTATGQLLSATRSDLTIENATWIGCTTDATMPAIALQSQSTLSMTRATVAGCPQSLSIGQQTRATLVDVRADGGNVDATSLVTFAGYELSLTRVALHSETAGVLEIAETMDEPSVALEDVLAEVRGAPEALVRDHDHATMTANRVSLVGATGSTCGFADVRSLSLVETHVGGPAFAYCIDTTTWPAGTALPDESWGAGLATDPGTEPERFDATVP